MCYVHCVNIYDDLNGTTTKGRGHMQSSSRLFPGGLDKASRKLNRAKYAYYHYSNSQQKNLLDFSKVFQVFHLSYL